MELFGGVNLVRYALINIHTIREMHTKLSVNPKDITVEDFLIDERTISVAQWLRCCATNRKVAGSIPDGVTGIFH